jgi:O-antigen ligase
MFSRNQDWWYERGILSLTLAMLVFAPLAFGAVDEWAFLVMEGLAAGVFILWGVRLCADSKFKLLWPPLAWAVAAFALYAAGRYFTADIEYVARVEVIQVLLFAFMFFAVINNLHGQDETQVISFTLIALATLISGYAVTQLLLHSERVWNLYSGYLNRAGGTYISPNDLAGFLEMLLPLALAFLLVGRVGVISRILLGYAAIVMLAGLAVTFSRAGWIAALAGILLLLGILLGHRNHRLKAMILLLIMLGGGGFAVKHYLVKTAGFAERVFKADANGGPGVMDYHSRLNIWQAANRMWQDHFWPGVGPAHFDYRFDAYRPETTQLRPGHVHNDYLNLLTDWGTLGGIIVFAGIGIFIFSLLKTWPHTRRAENDFGHGQSNRFAFFIGAISGLFALAVHSVMDFNLHIPANALTGVVLLALLSSNCRFATEKYWFRCALPIKIILTGSILAIVVAFAADEYRRVPETLWLSRAERQPVYSVERAEFLEKAFAAEPANFRTAYEIGECFRDQSFHAGDDLGCLAQRAMVWYAKAMKLNPYDTYSYLGTGICLDWAGQISASKKWYDQAETLDPNGFFTAQYIGWHYVQAGDFVAAREYFVRATKLAGIGNNYSSSLMAQAYLKICDSKLAQVASGAVLFPPP